VARIRVGLMGADGSMGMIIARLGFNDPELQFVAAYTVGTSPNLGRDLGSLVGSNPCGVILSDTLRMEEDLVCHSPEVIIDFTAAKATEQYAPLIINAGVALVIGTTGLSDDFEKTFKQLVVNKKGAVVKSSNMAPGVNIFFKIAAEIARHVPDWDIEIIETHHNRKKDSPSGTALMVGQKIAETLGRDFNTVAQYGRNKGPNLRKKGKEEIGVHAIRAGDIVGDHMILYAGSGERIELVHRAHNRECFAAGAIKALKFIAQHRNVGKIYSMQEVFNL
jgi:4-hydroxy-tetrahydrodipicolinate reductase